MERFARLFLFVTILIVPISASAAEIKAFKLVQTVYADDKDAQLTMPEGIACNDKSDFVVADTGNGRLVKYAYRDDKLTGGDEIKIPQMPYPVRLQLSSKGEIYALDEKLLRIVKLTSGGGFAGYLEPQGVPAPEKIIPRSFKLDVNDNIYILDLAGNRVLVLDPTGKFQRQIPLPGDGGFYSDLTVVAGDIYLLGSTRAAVFVSAKGSSSFAPLTKDLKEYVSFPTYLTSDNRGLLYIVDQNGDGVVTIGYDGSFIARRLVMGWKEGQVNYPSQVCIAGGNDIMIADRNNSRVQIFEIVR